MAIDEILLESLHNNNNFSGFLRFYRWDPPALSFGYNQKINQLINIDFVRKLGYGIVKRPTGGRMVYHADELTFSVGFRLEDILKTKSDKFLDCFIRAISPFVKALNETGIPAKFSDHDRVKRRSINQVHCFASAAGHSIFVGTKKLIGAAGMVKKGVIAVHGSLPITINFPEDTCFKEKVKISRDVDMACLSDFLAPGSLKMFPETVVKNFSSFFATKVSNLCLSVDECEKSEKLATQKFSDLNWKR
jgi:lipoate-protein ligase A